MVYTKNQNGVMIPIKDIHLNFKNPRKEYDKEQLRELQMSLAMSGQLAALILDEKGVILSGHRRYKAAKLLGWTELRCDIKIGLSDFDKSAVLISANTTQIKFNSWEYRDAISDIFWNEFCEEYTFKSEHDKGYTEFASRLGLSIAHVRKIAESTAPVNKKNSKALRKAGFSPSVIDEILTTSDEFKDDVVELAIKRVTACPDESPSSTREFLRAARRKLSVESKETISTKYQDILVQKVSTLVYELTDDIIELSEMSTLKQLNKNLKKLETFRKQLEESIA